MIACQNFSRKKKFIRKKIEELMGTNRPTYIRVGGSVRNKRWGDKR